MRRYYYFGLAFLIFSQSVLAQVGSTSSYSRTPYYPGQQPTITGFYSNPAKNPQTATTTAVADLIVKKQEQNGFSSSDPRVTQTLKNAGLATIGGVAGTILTNVPDGAGVATAIAVGGLCMGGSLGVGSFGCAMLGWGAGVAVRSAVATLLGWVFNDNGTVQTSVGVPITSLMSGSTQWHFAPSMNCPGDIWAISPSLAASQCAVLARETWGSSGPEYSVLGCIQHDVYVTCNMKRGAYTGVGELDYFIGGQQETYTGSTCSSGISSNGSCVTVSSASKVFSNQQAAVDSLTSEQRAKNLDASTLAALANTVIKATQNVPGSLPENMNNPVTLAEAQAVIDRMGVNAPTVGDMFALVNAGQVPNASSMFTSSATLQEMANAGKLDRVTTPVQPDTNVGGSTQDTGTNTSKVDLGPDPGIGSPTLEGTPTASMILGPILNLMPDLKNFSVPAHTGVCPIGSFTVFSKTYTLDSHCLLIEQNRSIIEVAMLLAWTLASVFIVLRA